MEQQRRDRIAQWAFDSQQILRRFHLWLEDVDESWSYEEGVTPESFVGGGLERALVLSAAVTALGTRLFGGYGDAQGLDKHGMNRVKKDADAVSAYALSESLWYFSRALPENHAILVSLGEGLMPKSGETPEMGSNPLLGFGRVYARPQVARFVDARVHRLLNHPDYGWDEFWADLGEAGITVWGAAIDTLENTSRFAKGDPTGPMTVLHLYDQPLRIEAPYEGYVGCMVVPRTVVAAAAANSVLIGYHTPRRLVLEAIRQAYPDIRPERVHVWTLGGSTRQARLQPLWTEWRELGCHLVEDGWKLPGAGAVFTDSGTYAPVYRVGTFDDGGERHLLVFDGYAASAEAIQAATLDPVLDNHSSLALFTSRFALPVDRERQVGALDPDAVDFAERLATIAGDAYTPELASEYAACLREARDAGLPCGQAQIAIDDFFPHKRWRVLAIAGHMLPDPYTGLGGVEQVGEGTYRVTVRAATRLRSRTVTVTLRLNESLAQSRLVFSPLLERFCSGEDFRSRAVKISDSGRIRNELQTLCSEALDHVGDAGIRVHFDRIEDAVLPAARKAVMREALTWYKANHPTWFRWLEICD